jgi:hypothetical protein
MNITWKIKHPMPTYLWNETAKLAIGQSVYKRITTLFMRIKV